MTKDVLVSISGIQMSINDGENSDDEPIEVLNSGTYYYKNGKHYVFFEEVAEGLQGVTKTQIKWKDSEFLEVSKKGLSNVHMIFERNKKNRCYYDTPFGQLNLGIFMTDMLVDEKENHIHIQAEYSLDVNYEPLADCTIQIHICPKDSKEFSLSEKMTF
ncbi:MAG: DUF1934 domain-containing protein [Tyzzerella sp.]|nr:DUF1934 domain-containing protein [Tyzzerella sp.]